MASASAASPPADARCSPVAGPRAARNFPPEPVAVLRQTFQWLKKRADFLAVNAGARSGRRAFLLIRFARGDGEATMRAGLTVTKKLGGAVLRNRIKRRLRAACRAVLPLHGEAGCDYVLVARAPAADMVFADLLDDLAGALQSLARAAR